MFIVTILGKKHLFLNSKDDDFVSCLPQNFGCLPSDISLEYVDEDKQLEIKREMAMNPDLQYEYDLNNLKLIKTLPPTHKNGDDDPKFVKEKNPNHPDFGKKARKLDNEDPECKPSKADALTLTTKQVVSIEYEDEKDKITGRITKKMRKMIIQGGI
jgi:hypothetical protein